MKNLLIKVAMLALLLASPFALMAQDSSSMTGIVTDQSGAVVAGTTVTLTNPSRGISQVQVSNNSGVYRFVNVPAAGGYVVTFEHTGFSKVQISNVALLVGITRTQDAKLVAGTNVQLEVSAAANEVTLDTTDASVGNNLDVKLVNELPIQNRGGLGALFALQPGYANGAITGARVDQNSVSVDGLDTNDIAAGSNLAVVGNAPVDSVQEFRATVAGLPSNLGTGGGGQFQLVTRSGTNQFHGNLNEYHRDTATAANPWFNNNSKLPRTPLIRNQFGGSIGGPIWIPKVYNGKDKLFFFFDYYNSRIISSSSANRTVPLDSFRNGNFNYILATASNGTGACAATSRLNLTPQCIGTLTAAQFAALDPSGTGFNPAVLTFINARYPHANDLAGGDGINTGGFRFTQPTPDILLNYVGKIDYKLTSKHQLSVRVTAAHEDAVQGLNEFPTDPLTSPFQDRSYGYVASDTWQIGSNKVNQFYYGDSISKLNFPNLYNPSGALVFGLGGLSGPYITGSTQKRRVPIPLIRDDFNWTKGNHNIGFGGTFKFVKTNSNLVNDFSNVTVGLSTKNPSLDPTMRPTTIRGGTTAPGLYDSLFATAVGHIAGISSNYNYTPSGTAIAQGSGATRRYRFYQTELYVGDTWKVTKSLTVTYGLRYQLYSVPYETNGEQSNQNLTFDQLLNARVTAANSGATGHSVVPLVTYNLGGKANKAGPLYNPSYKDFAPRFAFAFNPSFSKKTVFNGSAALVLDRTVINAINFLQDQNSFLFQNTAGITYGAATSRAAYSVGGDPRLGSNSSGGLTVGSATIPTAPAISKPYQPFVSGGVPFGGSSGTGYSYIVDPNLKTPYSIALNFGMQQEFPDHIVMKLNYVGRMGRRLLAQTDGAQVIDFKDPTSSQYFSQAFANATTALRAGSAVAKQPWFENQIGSGGTAFVVANLGDLIQLGDAADFANALYENGLTNPNVNVGDQFALNPWITNKGFSSYNGLLLTVSKNLSQGVQFDLNYTWSHSMDNVSSPANYQAASTLVNFICDATNLRKCRGNSDFDIQNVISSDFIAELPFGRGKTFLGSAPAYLNEVVGGWSFSGTPSWRSGVAVGSLSGAFMSAFNEDAPAYFNGNRGAVATHLHKVGSSLQAFSDQNAALAAFSGPIGLTPGSRNNLRGPSAFTMDAGLAKLFPIYKDKVNLKFRSDFYNILNHPVFGTQNADITSTSFGQVTTTPSSTQAGGPRVGQFSLRLEF